MMSMRQLAVLLRITVMLIFGLMSSAALVASPYEHCNALLSEGLKNIRLASSEVDWRNYLFHKICRKEQSGWSVDLGIFDLGSLGIGSNDAEAFCENQAGESRGRVAEFTYTSQLAKGALSAWNECQRLANENKVFIQPTFGETFLSFTIRRAPGVVAKLLAVNYSSSLELCNVSTEETEAHRPFKSGDQLNLSLTEANLFVHCQRKQETLRDETVITPTAEVSVFVSQAPAMIIVLPEEVRRVPIPKLTQLQGSIDSVEKRLISKIESSVDVWPSGGHCVFRKGGACPAGFSQGWLHIDTEDNDSDNKWSGTLPDGDYKKNNIDLFFCCT